MVKIIVFLALITSLTFSQTTYIWTGAVNSNFSTAGNWSPIRQVGYSNDILIFESGNTLNVQNVNQVTLGQLIIRNNTNVSFSPSAGNAKTISIKGCDGNDLVVESGSSLKISGNDPQLNLYILSGATAVISGSLAFQGAISHNINAVEPNSIFFENGSVFTQLCPGNIFNTNGSNGVAIFESGSKLVLNHQSAQNPFGLSAPNSKISFENEGTLVIEKAASFSLNGRTIGNLIIESGNNISINENFISDASVNNLTVKQGSMLNIKNNSEVFKAALNIKGDLNIEGSLNFDSQNFNNLNVIFNGNSEQNIFGQGEIIFPRNLSDVTISNNIKLLRTIIVNANLHHTRGIINYNNFHIYTPNARTPEYSANPELLDNLRKTEVNATTPDKYSISQNYPNPFNPSTKIDFTLPENSKVSIKVFDISGKEIAVILNSELTAGNHSVNFNAANLSSGIYFYTINTGKFQKTMKMVLAK